ncbi:hypothetical protein VM1G_04465 [Cytospora mali]|uniref:Uncharacterized protein n=1 Tax=Cytospora mali TaxID=578113 RepID=A0A194VWV6_CYTMA|nr:hypothetical protein VM1G_04465 [Valsa mali]
MARPTDSASNVNRRVSSAMLSLQEPPMFSANHFGCPKPLSASVIRVQLLCKLLNLEAKKMPPMRYITAPRALIRTDIRVEMVETNAEAMVTMDDTMPQIPRKMQ